MERNREKIHYIIPFVVCIFILNIMIWHMGATFNIIYDDCGGANSATLFWRSTNDNAYTGWNSVTSNIRNKRARLYLLKNLPMTAEYRLDFTNNSFDISVNNLKICYGIIPLMYFSGEELYHNISKTGNIKNTTTYGGKLCIEPQNEDPIVYFNSDFARLINKKIKIGCLSFCLFVDCVIAAYLYITSKYKKRMYDSIEIYNLKYRHKVIIAIKLVSCFSLIISAGLVCYIALYSELGAHPDEGMTKMAIDYYLSKWIPPDMRGEDVAGTFSVYGHSRLEEMNIYYLLAGKIGFLFKTLWHCSNYYRAFNVCLYLIICLIVIKNIWKESWLVICSIATPQLCYIFSYATSDACDYFWCFLLIYQVIVKDSMLNRALTNNSGKKKYLQLSLIGALSAFIFIGKANYYAVLLLVFIIFLFKLMKSKRIESKRVIKDYFFILLIFVIAVMIRYSFDLYYYGFERAEILSQLKEQHAEYPFKQSTPIEERYSGLNLKEQGVSLEELYDDYSFLVMSFKSFFGVYGRMDCFSDNFYYLVLGIAYTLLILMLIDNIFKLSGKIDRLEYVAVMVTIPVSIILSIYHSWTGDFQPQGRYLLPMLIGMGYLISKVEDKDLETLCITVMAVINMIVPYGFYKYGVLQII